MLILGINTAVPQTEITLLEDDKVLLNQTWESNFNEAEKLLPAVEKALAKVPSGQLDKIFVVQGPGSFTGLRVGITIANTLAFVHGCEIISSTTFEYFSHKVIDTQSKNTAIVLRAGGQNVAIKLPKSKNIHTINKEEISKHVKGVKYIVSDIRKENRETHKLPSGTKWLSSRQMKTFPEVIKDVISTNPTTQKIVKPLYLAPPSITKSKKEVFV